MAALEEQKQHLLLNLFDSHWFHHLILNKTKNPFPQIHKNHESAIETTQNQDFFTLPTIKVRSYSDQLCLSSKHQAFITDSPNSVLNLHTPKLQTILSGKVGKFEEKEVKSPAEDVKISAAPVMKKKKKKKEKKKRGSKSLSELEFEELKGFMDLGFVFSEKDKGSSSLVSIIPGLQRLGKDGKNEKGFEGSTRPYLSEAWDVLENHQRKAVVPVMIKIPGLGNEVEIKHQLKFWAHSVASAVR